MSKISEQIRKFLTHGINTSPANSNPPAFNEEYFGHIITLMEKGEIRFGPPYFDLLIDNAKLINKTFGMNIWMLDDYLFGAEEWLTTSEQNGPLTRLVLFNLKQMKCSTMKQIHGFPELVRIESSYLIYSRREKNLSKEVEVAFEEITNWSPIFGTRW
jgi:hypothetical protein